MTLNNIDDSGVKIILTGGFSTDGYTLQKPNLIISQLPLALVDAQRSAGLRLVTYMHQRQLPHIKTIDYIMAIWLQPYIKEQNADDVLYMNDNMITECPRGNIFIVTQKNEIATPGTNILKGIIRTQILRHFSTDFTIIERDITLEELVVAKEVFVTSSTKNIFPVASINGKIIGDGNAGPITRQLGEKLNNLILENTKQYYD